MTRLAPLVRHPVAIAGAVIATVLAVLFIALAIAAVGPLFDNPYAGLVVFVAVPAMFLFGLLLILLGMWLERRQHRGAGEAAEWPVLDFRRPRVRRGALLIAAMTFANIVIVLLAGYGSLRAIGDRIRVVREYADDEQSSETRTVLQMHLGTSSTSAHAIHWHANPAVRVEYVSTDAANETIPYVKVTAATGEVREYATPDATDEMIRAGTRRTMDCIDCHNTVGHPIAATPERAVDEAIAAGFVSRQLPHARREGVRLLKASYASEEDALHAIDREFRGFYQSRGGAVDEAAVERAVAALQALYRRNVFPTMKVTWGSYPANGGHLTATGCFRCHDDTHKAKNGTAISADCEYCHKQVDVPSMPPERLTEGNLP